jgi:hypothetical protein
MVAGRKVEGKEWNGIATVGLMAEPPRNNDYLVSPLLPPASPLLPRQALLIKRLGRQRDAILHVFPNHKAKKNCGTDRIGACFKDSIIIVNYFYSISSRDVCTLLQ